MEWPHTSSCSLERQIRFLACPRGNLVDFNLVPIHEQQRRARQQIIWKHAPQFFLCLKLTNPPTGKAK